MQRLLPPLNQVNKCIESLTTIYIIFVKKDGSMMNNLKKSYKLERAAFIPSKKDMTALQGIFGREVDGRVSVAYH